MTSEEVRDYNEAKKDLLEAMHSFQKLKPEYQQQLISDIVGAEAYALAWQAIQNVTNIPR